MACSYYTIPSDNRELQPKENAKLQEDIIPYQVITGNYNCRTTLTIQARIIPYQVITGNYNFLQLDRRKDKLYHTK